MKIQLMCMGTVKESHVAALVNNYAKRADHYWPFRILELADVRMGKGVDAEKQKELEGAKFLAEIGTADFVVLFDERGREMTSREFSDFIQRKAVELPRNLVFVIGGPYGFSKEMYSRADMLMSLSKMTLPHELARLFATEQLYRAGTISRGEPYHHD